MKTIFLLGLAAVLAGCATGGNIVTSPDRPAKIMVLLKNPGEPAGVSMDPANDTAIGIMTGLVGGAIYAAVIHRPDSELAPLRKELDACRLPNALASQLARDLAAHPHWVVVSSSDVDVATANAFERYFVDAEPGPDDRRRMTTAARAQGITHALLVSLPYHGIYYARDAKSLYDVTASELLFDLSRPESDIFTSAVDSRGLPGRPLYVSLNAEEKDDGAAVCDRLLEEGAAASHALAGDLGVPSFVPITDPYGAFNPVLYQ